MTTEQTQAAAEFFFEHAGYSYDPKTETADDGKRRGAIELAESEAWARDRGLVFTWSDDWDGDHSYLEQESFAGYQISTCEHCAVTDEAGNVLASLGCIDDATDDYRRVIEAELASEARGEIETQLDAINLDYVFAAYVECALWSSNDESTPEGGEPFDANYSSDDIDADSLALMRDDVNQFCEANVSLLAGMDPGMIGHDFWLTRNHHGAGFWDRGLGERGEKLSAAAHVYGESDLYVGDDGKVYVS